MYSKISTSENNISNLSINLSLDLESYEKIKNIEVLNKDKLLILIESDDKIRGIIYDINKNIIIGSIDR